MLSGMIFGQDFTLVNQTNQSLHFPIDIDNDGTLELFGNTDENMQIFDASNLSIKWTLPNYSMAPEGFGGALLWIPIIMAQNPNSYFPYIDYNGDNNIDLLYWTSTSFGILDIPNNISIFEQSENEPVDIIPFLVDIENDGIFELILSVTALESDYEKTYVYSTDISLSTENDNGIANPSNYKLHQNYPNPFNPVTRIKYDVEKSGLVKLNIYNIRGELVDTIIDEYKTSGSYSTKWNPISLSSGQYIYQIEIDGKDVSTKKAVYLK
jgi:hypothetical protein